MYPFSKTPFVRLALISLVLSLPAPSAQATNWQYLGGSNSYNQASGRPNAIVDKSSVLPADLLQTIINRLPEGQSIASNPEALAQLTDDLGANVFLKATANVKISYVAEGAGYENAVGFFKFSGSDLATLNLSDVNDNIIFPNFSDTVLQFGNAVDLGNFAAGDAIGFTIVANGWLPGISSCFGYEPGTGIVDPDKPPHKIFRSIKRFNPEPESGNLHAHTILFAYPEQQLLVLGFEDLNRESENFNDGIMPSDDDFNDVLIAIHVDPWTAVDCSHCNYLVTPTPTPSATPTPVVDPKNGQQGPVSWREVTSAPEVIDNNKEAKAASRSSKVARKLCKIEQAIHNTGVNCDAL